MLPLQYLCLARDSVISLESAHADKLLVEPQARELMDFQDALREILLQTLKIVSTVDDRSTGGHHQLTEASVRAWYREALCSPRLSEVVKTMHDVVGDPVVDA